MMILKVTLKGILKLYFTLTISSLMRSLEKFWKSCNKIYIRVETLFAFCSLNLGALPTLRIAGFKGREKLCKIKNMLLSITSAFYKPISKIFTSNIRTENMMFLREVCP